MSRNGIRSVFRLLALVGSVVGAVAACGSKPPPAVAAAGAAPGTLAVAPAAPSESMPVAQPLTVNDQTWTEEAMEALLAPIALYPDPVLSQVLMASTDPQQVLDAGNWLIDHPQLADKALDQAATAAGFTPTMRALMQFRQIVDQMCLKMGWTTELGQAFTNDQAGVLAAVQRLRRQALKAGTLENSPQMAVATQEQGGQESIVISPPTPQVVYVPEYDPTVAYGQAPPTEDTGYEYADYATTGVLAFGAGLIVGNVFDGDADDYYHQRYYYPNYGYGRYPPCPPHRYRPRYDRDHRPGHYYNRPPHYDDTLRDRDFIVAHHRGDEYWNHFDERAGDRPRANLVPSPITAARMNRAPPAEFSAARGAPRGREEATTWTPGSQLNTGTRNQRSHDRGSDEQPYDASAEPRLQGSAQEQARYSAARQQPARGGDRLPPDDEGGRGPRPNEDDRGQQHGTSTQGPRLLVVAQEPPKYSSAPAPHTWVRDGQASGTETAQPQRRPAEQRAWGSAQSRPAPADVPASRPTTSNGGAEHDGPVAWTPVRVAAPPPAPPRNGDRASARTGSHDAGRSDSAGPRAHDGESTAPGRNAGNLLPQQR
jgi:hypothetical protein